MGRLGSHWHIHSVVPLQVAQESVHITVAPVSAASGGAPNSPTRAPPSASSGIVFPVAAANAAALRRHLDPPWRADASANHGPQCLSLLSVPVPPSQGTVYGADLTKLHLNSQLAAT